MSSDRLSQCLQKPTRRRSWTSALLRTSLQSRARVPFINFFDGFRTSHEIQKIEVWDYEDLKEMCDMDAVEAFRERALNPERPANARLSRERRYLLPAP